MNKKKITKLLALLLVFLTGVTAVFTYVNADTTMTIKASTDSLLKQGTYYNDEDQEVTYDYYAVDIKLENPNKNDIKSVGCVVKYDPTKFEYVDYDVSSQMTQFATKIVQSNIKEDGSLDIEDGKASIYILYGDRPTASKSENLKVTTLRFKPKDGTVGVNNIEVSAPKVTSDGETEYEDIATENASISIEAPVDQNSIKLTTATFNLDVTDKKNDTIQITYSPANTTTPKNFTYKSNNTSVVTVDDTGKLTAVGNGTTTITIKAFGKELTANVTVTTAVSGISLSESNFNLNLGETKTLTATITPSTAQNKTVTWTSSDTNVAVVDQNGKVTAKNVGTTIITAKTTNGKVATANLTVKDPTVPISSLSINNANVTLTGTTDTKELVITVNPDDATVNDVEWSSANGNVSIIKNASDPLKATIGVIKGGTDVITAKVKGKNTQTITANVTINIPITNTSVNKTEVTLFPGQTEKITHTIEPTGFTGDSTIIWTSSNNSVAIVDATGTIKAVGVGTATVTVNVQSFTKTINVTVNQSGDGIVLSETNPEIKVGEEKTLIATITPVTAVEKAKWSTSDASIVSVDQNGKIKGLKAGSAVITAELLNGQKATATVNVYVPVSKVETDATSNKVTIEKGSKKVVTATITPSNATYKNITWTSSNSSVAKVIPNGNKVEIEGIAAGTAIITGTLPKGEKVEVEVTIIVPITAINVYDGTTKVSDSSKTIEIVKGDTKGFTTEVLPTDTSENTTVKWASKDTSIAEVDQTGHVVGKKAGTTEITAKAGNVTATVKVKVIVPITGFAKENDNEINLLRKEKITLNPVITPVDTTEDKTITWTSSDANIAVVNSKGEVTAVGGTEAGQIVTIMGTLKNGKQVSYQMTIKIVKVTDLKFEDKNSSSSTKPEIQDYVVYRTNKESLVNSILSVYPLNATEIEGIVWSSSDESIAKVNPTTGEITPLAVGKTTITVTLDSIVKTIDIEVKEIKLDSITVKEDIKKINVGDVIDLTIVKNPLNATEDVTFTYSSSDNTIIKVDENGKLKAVGVGTATITVTASNGVKVSYEIKVEGKEQPALGVKSAISYGLSSLTCLGGILMTIKKLRENEITLI